MRDRIVNRALVTSTATVTSVRCCQRRDVQDPESLMTPQRARPFFGISEKHRFGVVDAGPALGCSESGPARVAGGGESQVFGPDESGQLLGCCDCGRTGRRYLAIDVSGPEQEQRVEAVRSAVRPESPAQLVEPYSGSAEVGGFGEV
jgi:hypothetical protein